MERSDKRVEHDKDGKEGMSQFSDRIVLLAEQPLSALMPKPSALTPQPSLASSLPSPTSAKAFPLEIYRSPASSPCETVAGTDQHVGPSVFLGSVTSGSDLTSIIDAGSDAKSTRVPVIVAPEGDPNGGSFFSVSVCPNSCLQSSIIPSGEGGGVGSSGPQRFNPPLSQLSIPDQDGAKYTQPFMLNDSLSHQPAPVQSSVKQLPYSLLISGEPDGPERVENLIKLAVSIIPQKAGVLAVEMNWNKLCISAGVFSSPKGVDVLTMPTQLLLPDPLVHAKNGIPTTESIGDSFLVAEVAVVKKNSDGVFEPAVPCEKCVEREIRKLNGVIYTSSMRAVAASTVAEHTSRENSERLRSGCTRTMLVFHNSPVIAINQNSGAPNFVLKFRIFCYSSHQKGPLFVLVRLWDPLTGSYVGEALSKPIIIQDNHKNKRKNAVSASSGPSASEKEPPQGRSKKRRRTEKGIPPETEEETSVPPPPAWTGQNSLPFIPDGCLSITKVEPSSGSVTGGVRITVTGQGFSSLSPGCQLAFGTNIACDTNICDGNTLVCTLPASSQAGSVPVTIQGAECRVSVCFTYIDDRNARLLTMVNMAEAASAYQQPLSGYQPLSESEHNGGSGGFSSQTSIRTNVFQGDFRKDEENILHALESVRATDLFLLEENTGMTLMHFAAMMDYTNLSRFLLKHAPALAVIGEKRGYTPLHFACLFSATSTVMLLLEQESVDVRQRATDGRTAFSFVTDPRITQLLQDSIRRYVSASSSSTEGENNLSGRFKYDDTGSDSRSSEYASDNSATELQSIGQPPDIPAGLFAYNGEEEQLRLLEEQNYVKSEVNDERGGIGERQSQAILLNSFNPFVGVNSFPFSNSVPPDSVEFSGSFPSSGHSAEITGGELSEMPFQSERVIEIGGAEEHGDRTVHGWFISHAQQTVTLMIVSLFCIVIVSIASMKPGGYNHGSEPVPAEYGYDSSEMQRLIRQSDQSMLELRVLTILSCFIYGCVVARSLVKGYHKHWLTTLVVVVISFAMCLYHTFFALAFY